MTTAEKTPPDAAAAADVVGGTEDPGGVGVAGGLVALTKAATRSRAAVKAGGGLSAESVRIALRRSTVAPAKGDHRLGRPSWDGNPRYRRLQQGDLGRS